MEASDFMDVLGLEPLYNGFYLFRVSRYPMGGYDISQEVDLCGHELTLLKVGEKAFLPESFADCSKMLKMVRLGLTIDEDIIKVDDQKDSYERSEDLSHEPHEGAWGI